MARVLIDDMTEELIRGESEGGSVKLTLDGDSVELDLTTASQDKLREVLRPYFDAGRFIPKPGTPRNGAPAARSGEDGPSDQEIRQWAQGQGLEVGDYGRLPGRIREAYWRAHDGAAVNGTADPEQHAASEAPETPELEPDEAPEGQPDDEAKDLDDESEDPPRPEQLEIAEDLLDRGMPIPTIAQQTGMSVQQVRDLKAQVERGGAVR